MVSVAGRAREKQSYAWGVGKREEEKPESKWEEACDCKRANDLLIVMVQILYAGARHGRDASWGEDRNSAVVSLNSSADDSRPTTAGAQALDFGW
jgi:hypothetical protein